MKLSKHSKQSAYPRGLAVRILTRVLSDSEPLDTVIQRECEGLPTETRSWLQDVCFGTLRWKGRLDFALDSIASKKKPTGWLRKMLLVAAYQLIVQERTRSSNVVFETVEEIKNKEGNPPAQFANACLRKLSSEPEKWNTKVPSAQSTPSAKRVNASVEAATAAWASLPPWLWNLLVRDHGAEWTIAYAQACLERPVTWVRGKTRGKTPGENANWQPEWAKPGPIENSWVSDGGSITSKSGYNEGLFFVQDISNQILISDISNEVFKKFGADNVRGGKPPSALDLCAAPGGKAVGLAWNGFQVSATDRPAGKDDHRLVLLKENISRLHPEIAILPRDQIKSLPKQDLVWVDAPCSGTGIIRRHPDTKWLRKENELSELNRLQTELIKEAWGYVRAGGFLAYSVCSVLKDEGEGAIVRAGLKEFISKSWFLEPQREPFGDGFWGALLRKPSS